MERHFLIGERPLTFEELVEMSRRNPRKIVRMMGGELMFTQQGEFELSKNCQGGSHAAFVTLFTIADAYKDNYVTWMETSGKVIRPNIECTNGIIHTVDTVMIDDAPPWSVGRAANFGGKALDKVLVAAAVAIIVISNFY